MSREKLIEMARSNIAHARAGTTDLTDAVLRVPARHYTDPERHQRELTRIFERVPLMLAFSAEIPHPGDTKAMHAAGMPVLITRKRDGKLGVYVNMCRHRGSQIVPDGPSHTRRFVCPYHAWTYDDEGALVGIFRQSEFGEIDRSCHGLVRLPAAERAGLVWVVLDPESRLEIDAFLSGYDSILAHFGFAEWKLAARREIAGPNWKIAYDGYLDLYHLPILHKQSFGADAPCQALYEAWGPHQRVSSPDPQLFPLAEQPEASWPTEALTRGVWTIFPHVSIATFDAGVPGVLVSQLFPGPTELESLTVQSYLTKREPQSGEEQKQLDGLWDLLGEVVENEDYATGLRQQRALRTGVMEHVLFGRNEGGGQAFHGWVERLLSDDPPW